MGGGSIQKCGWTPLRKTVVGTLKPGLKPGPALVPRDYHMTHVPSLHPAVPPAQCHSVDTHIPKPTQRLVPRGMLHALCNDHHSNKMVPPAGVWPRQEISPINPFLIKKRSGPFQCTDAHG